MYDACPDCSEEFLHISFEDNEIEYSCDNCDWYAIEKDVFYLGGWSITVNQALAPVDILQSLLTDQDIVEFLRPRLKGVSYLDKLPRIVNDSDEYFKGEVDSAHQIFLKQMIVLAVTYIELILKDFFRSLFIAYPARMNRVLPPFDKKKADIPLAEILETSSKEELLANLADQAANRKAGGQFDKVLKGLIDDCKIELDRPFIDDVRELKEWRNRIVHDEAHEKITLRQVHSSFGLILYLLYVLAEVAKKYKVPFWDDVGFLIDFEKNLMPNKANKAS